MGYKLIQEQVDVLNNDKKNMLVSASAGSGKTFIMIKYITQLVVEKKIPVSQLLVLTFTKAAANEMKERLVRSLKECGKSEFIIEQIDSLPTANISTIDSYCEKMIKKHANLIGISENFSIVDENYAQNIRNRAFENAFKEFENNNYEQYLVLIDYYKNSKERIKNILFEIETLMQVVSNREKFLKENLNPNADFFKKATEFLYNFAINNIKKALFEIEVLGIENYYKKLESVFAGIIESKDIFELAKKLKNIENFPTKPRVNLIGQECSDIIDVNKKKLSKVVETVNSLNLWDESNVAFQKEGSLERTILNLFVEYQKQEEAIKRNQNVLDFGDLERYMSIISEKENLFDGLKYVFVDEYQDTNKIQERIVKNVAKNCNFVAVGDAKQGIYGFRLASCEIFLDDMQKFEEDKDSAVKYLKSNFRSDIDVLNFVNSVFEVCMTEENCGIDYKKTSMLTKGKDFKREEKNAVYIDVVMQQKEETRLEKVYSVKNDDGKIKNDNLLQMLDVKRRIFEVRKTKIFEEGEFRDCRYSDISIISRSRGKLFYALQEYLLQSGIPVVSSASGKLFDEVEVKVLLDLLRVAKNFDDEIALLSVLLSPFGGFKLEEIIDNKNDKNLCEAVLENKFFEKFVEKICAFRKDIFVFGVRKALETLFENVNYYSYINAKIQHSQILYEIKQFMEKIFESGYEFDLCGLINFFETVEIDIMSEPADAVDAVSMHSIHETKGLEYPIVFLIGCDASFNDKPPKDSSVKIDENFGLALKYYDLESNVAVESIKMKAISLLSKQKNVSEELMIFYVALTRAKNKLYLFGRYNKNSFNRKDLSECSSYFDLIFYALKIRQEQILSEEKIEKNAVEINFIEEIEEISSENKVEKRNAEFDKNALNKVLDYLNFKYKIDDKLNFKLKETVTALSRKEQEEILEKYSNENFSFGGAGVDVGNAYHLALKVLDFSEIYDLKSLNAQIEKNKEVLSESLQFIDKNLLLKNILILKDLCGDGKIYKEKEFVVKEKICNLISSNLQDEILLQGVVDLFVVYKDKVVLVDYKYSNAKEEKYLIEKYKNQLKLYKIAIENAFNKKVEKSYLLSLKNSKIIPVEI